MAKFGGGSGSLVTVVTLTVVSVGLFVTTVVFVARSQRLQGELTQAQSDAQDIVSPAERNSDAVQALVQQARAERKSLVSFLSQSLQGTMRRVTGNERDTPATLGKALEGVAGADAAPLLAILAERERAAGQWKKEAEDAKASAAASQNDLQNEVARVTKALADQQATIASMNDELGKYRAEVESFRARTGTTIADNNKRVDDIRAKATAEKSGFEERVNRLAQENLVLKGQVEQLRADRSKDLLKPGFEGALADGRVVSVDPAEKVAFIDLKRSDRLVLGMTFEVYENETAVKPDSEGNYPRGKGTLEIIRIGDTSSAARIVRENKGNPVIAGDVLFNAVYDPRKTYRFVIAGDFDLNGDGVYSAAEREGAATLIRSWGGKTQEDIAGDTDFVVLGSRPRLPPQPPPDAPIAVINEFIRLQRTALEYDRLFETARQTGIPVLNQNRLLTLTGQGR